MMCRYVWADINRFPHTQHNSPLCTSSISNSLPFSFQSSRFLVFSVHNRWCGVKLRLLHQEEKADTEQTVSPTLPTLFMAALFVVPFLPTLRHFFSSLSSALSRVLRLGGGVFSPFPPLQAWKTSLPVRLLRPGWLTGLNWF